MKLLTLSIILTAFLVGCAPIPLPSSDMPTSDVTTADIPPWDERIELDSEDSDTTTLSDLISGALSEGDSNYHFRKVRWGFTQERVELAEAGKRVYERTENALVYKHRVNDIDCRLIYTFKDNKLRTAGYVTKEPIKNAKNLIEAAVEKHGMPTSENGGMVWKSLDTVIYADIYASVQKATVTKHDYSDGGLLQHLLEKELAQKEPGRIYYLDGAIGYVDRAFYDELHEIRSPLSELSFYEKQLMGIVQRGKRVIYPDGQTVPPIDNF